MDKCKFGSILILVQSLIASPTDSIQFYATQALEPAHFVHSGDHIFLYGIQTNGDDTKQGQWACAKVTSIILKKSHLINHIYLSVNQLEKKMSSWQKISTQDSLKPGDVVIWNRRYKANADGSCTGMGTCHIGIYTNKGYFHNSPLSKQATFDGPSLWAFKFKIAYRAPSYNAF